MGDLAGLTQGIISAFADTLEETAGFLVVRADRLHAVGDTDLFVDGLHRWDSAGRLVLHGQIYTYSSTTVTPSVCTLHGLATWSSYGVTPVVGLVSAAREGDVVTYYAESRSDLAVVRLTLFLNGAEGADLDVIARNYGLYRPRGIGDALFRDLLMILIYLDAGTMYACEKILDLLVGPSGYSLWDTPLDPVDHHKVFVLLLAGVAGFAGKTFLVGGEARPSTSPTTVDTAFDPVVVYGIYDVANPDPAHARMTPNLILESFSGFTNAAFPTFLQTLTPVFLAEDVSRSVIFSTGEIWSVLGISTPNLAILGIGGNTASVSIGSPGFIVSDLPVFRDWMVGHKVSITSASNPGNIGIATIIKVAAGSPGFPPNRVAFIAVGGVPVPWAGSDDDIIFNIVPDFPTTAALSFKLVRYTLAGNTITCSHAAFPPTVWVDYATVPGGQLMQDNTYSGEAQYPLYLFDDTSLVEEMLKLILDAGCHPVVTRDYS